MKHHTTHLLRSGLAKRLKWSKCQLALDPVPLRTLGSSVGALVSARGPATRAWQMAKQNGKRWRQWMEVACLCTCRRRQRVVQTATAPAASTTAAPAGNLSKLPWRFGSNHYWTVCRWAVLLQWIWQRWTVPQSRLLRRTSQLPSECRCKSQRTYTGICRNCRWFFRANWFWTLQDWLVEYE